MRRRLEHQGFGNDRVMGGRIRQASTTSPQA